jgi:hypothetical protein
MSNYRLLDLESVKEKADLLALVERDTHLKKVGKEYKGPCPMTGCPCDDDGFSVQPDKNTWVCRHCTGGKYRNVIDYIALRDGLDPHDQEQLTEICRRAMGGEVPTKAGQPGRHPHPKIQLEVSSRRRVIGRRRAGRLSMPAKMLYGVRLVPVPWLTCVKSAG